MKVLQLKLYPNQTQRRAIQNHIDANRFIYNYFLDYRVKQYAEDEETSSKYTLIKEITGMKKLEEFFWLKGINTATLQQTVIRLDKAFQNFFRRVKRKEVPGFPKFKSKKLPVQSYAYPAFVSYDNKTNKLALHNVGKVRCKGYRDLGGVIKQCVITLHADGTVLASIFIDSENQVSIKNTNQDSIGIDVGTRKFLTDSKGRKVKPFNYKKIVNKIVKQQRRLALAKKGSNNRQRTKNMLSKYYRQLANKRKDNLHKLANEYLQYRYVCVEDLKIPKMTQNTVGTVDNPNYDSVRKSRLNNSIRMASWGIFFNILAYKLPLRDSTLIKVSPHLTSQTCNKCHCYHPDSRKGESFKCVVCGYEEDADYNASCNIEYRGYNMILQTPKKIA